MNNRLTRLKTRCGCTRDIVVPNSYVNVIEVPLFEEFIDIDSPMSPVMAKRRFHLHHYDEEWVPVYLEEMPR